MSNIKVSVIVPVFNVESYLNESLELPVMWDWIMHRENIFLL